MDYTTTWPVLNIKISFLTNLWGSPIEQKLFQMDILSRNEILSSDSDNDVISQRVFDTLKAKKRMREERVSAIKVHLDMVSTQPLRKQRWNCLYFLQIILFISSSLTNAKLLINDDGRRQFYSIILISCLSCTCIFTFIGNLQVADMVTTLKLYFHLDSVMPVVIAGSIGLHALLDFRPIWPWENYVFVYIYPFWMVCLAGTVRVHIRCEHFSRIKIVILKVTVFFCGFLTFYVGYTFMNGAYKISAGLLPQIEAQYKNLVYLYVFGLVEFMFELIRRISDFDQTTDLKPYYQFKSEEEKQADAMANVEVKREEGQAMIEGAIQSLFQRNVRHSHSGASSLQ